MTIIDAIKQVMEASAAPITAREAYDAIVERRLYEFHAQDAAHVVLMQIRRHCEGIDFPTAKPTKHFKLVGENRFIALNPPKRIPNRSQRGRRSTVALRDRPSLATLLRDLEELHDRYVDELKARVISDLRRLPPAAFETFAKQLLDVYGFEETFVTQISNDGGIDGYGKLKVGLAHLNVAFQCKRWAKGNIQRTEIDKFRGAAQGDFEQGIFFATTSFSEGAIGASIKRGAVPIVLVDSDAIVDLMIEKRFGVQAESLTIPTYALDLALSPENGSLADGSTTSVPERDRQADLRKHSK